MDGWPDNTHNDVMEEAPNTRTLEKHQHRNKIYISEPSHHSRKRGLLFRKFPSALNSIPSI